MQRRCVFYETYTEKRGKIADRLCHVHAYRWTEEELITKLGYVRQDPHVTFRDSGVMNPELYTLRGLRLPVDKHARDWLLSLSRDYPLACWATRATTKFYMVMSQYKTHDLMDYCAGVFKTIDAARKVMDPGDRIIFGLTKEDVYYFLSEEPPDITADMWGVEDGN